MLPIFGIALSPWTSQSSYRHECIRLRAELVRAAIQRVDRGQYEASIALNFPRLNMMRRILLPQAIRAILPAWATWLIDLLKSTSLIFFISITELTSRCHQQLPAILCGGAVRLLRHRARPHHAIRALAGTPLLARLRAGGAGMNIWDWSYVWEAFPYLYRGHDCHG